MNILLILTVTRIPFASGFPMDRFAMLTDFKTMSQLKLLVVGALGGRFDHLAAHINVLYKFSTMRIILLSDETLVYLLPQGYCHEISLNTTFEGPHCGLIPFGTTSESTTTTGLQWNLSMDAPWPKQIKFWENFLTTFEFWTNEKHRSFQTYKRALLIFFLVLDADETKMAFGSLVSTSNLLLGDFVTVISDTALVWTAALRIS